MSIYQHIFEHSPDALLMVDTAGRIADANLQAELMFELTRAELLGRTSSRWFPSVL